MVFVAPTTLSVAIQVGMKGSWFFAASGVCTQDIREIEAVARSYGPTVGKMAATIFAPAKGVVWEELSS